MTKIVLEEFAAKELNLLYLGSGGHGDHSTRFFGSHTKSFTMVNDNWPAIIIEKAKLMITYIKINHFLNQTIILEKAVTRLPGF